MGKECTRLASVLSCAGQESRAMFRDAVQAHKSTQEALARQQGAYFSLFAQHCKHRQLMPPPGAGEATAAAQRSAEQAVTTAAALNSEDLIKACPWLHS